MSTSATDLSAIRSLQKEIMEKQAKVNELMRSRAAEPVADVTFKGAGNADVRLSELFGDKDDLIVIHNMGRSCVYCTLWLDGFSGMHDHFTSRAAFVVVSPDTPNVQAEFAASRSWPFTMVSNADSGFTQAMGMATEQDGKTHYAPGFSTFKKNPDGSIERVANSWFGPGDMYCGIWHMFDVLDGGAKEWAPRFAY
jgi:predicted dithiol-disulfide oxidoreductase (DUF899 family)